MNLVVHSVYFPDRSWSDLHSAPDVLNCQSKIEEFLIIQPRYSAGEGPERGKVFESEMSCCC